MSVVMSQQAFRKLRTKLLRKSEETTVSRGEIYQSQVPRKLCIPENMK